MEKKGNRSVQAISKGPVADSKKNQDAANGKLWPRGVRRRESSLGNFSTKIDVSRKPAPQRFKNVFDKRPKPRGFAGGPHSHSEGPLARSEETGLEEPNEIELGSVFLPGSKKQSLNHLLNFVYAPRQQDSSSTPNKNGRALNTRKHKYNKEHFLQANCQFIVNIKGDYKQYMNDPDSLVDWCLIEQVNVQVSEYPACPICLYPPVAAKMTRCGHIYCWSCVLHYLSLSDKTWRKCPICYEAVHKADLKSVVAISHPTFNVDEIITFKLMKRQQGSLTAYPADYHINPGDTVSKMSDKNSADVYSKLLLADSADIVSIIDREKVELERQSVEEENSPEKCFVDEAVNLLTEREVNATESLFREVGVKKVDVQQKAEADRVEEFESDVVTCDDKRYSKFHYFYQASDGQHIYLHSINARMLEHTYGSLEFAPRILTGRILEKEGGSMTEDLRKRLRYLQHLPVTCQFEIAEIQLKLPDVSRDTLDFFYDRLEARRKKRGKRAKDEKRREKRIAEEENRKMGNYPEADIRLESQDQFPEFGFESRLRTDSENTFQSEEDGHSTYDSGSPVSCGGPSFATMLSKKPSPTWPNLKSTSNDMNNVGGLDMSIKLINVTGSRLTRSATVSGVDTTNRENDDELDNFEPVPQLNRSFGDVIAQALQKAAAQNESSLDNVESVNVGKKKKKRNKQKVLFATSMAYSGN